MLTSRSKSGRLVRTWTLPRRAAQEARVAARSASASATPTRAAAASASARLGAWPKTTTIFASPPGGREISPAKAATRRPSSRAAPSGAPVSTIAGVWMSRPGPPKKRVREVSVAGAARLVAAKAKPRSKSLFRIWKTSVAPTVSWRILPTLSLGLSSSARSKNGTTRSRFGRRPFPQRQNADVARPIGRDEHDIFRFEVAAAFVKVATPGS